MSVMLLTPYPGSILGPVAKVLGVIMNWIYNIVFKLTGVESVVLSIIIITIVIYMCLLPLTINQQKYSKLSQKMQPEIQAIQKKYKDRKDQASMTAMQQETQLVYDKYGVNPMGSCLPLVIQMPILFALYRVFYGIPAYISSIKEYFGIAKENGAVKVIEGSLVDIISKAPDFTEIMKNIVSDQKITGISVNFDYVGDDKVNVINNYIVDVLYKLPKSGWESLSSYFSGAGESVVSAIDGAVNTITPHINHFNYFLGLNISDTPWNTITTNFGVMKDAGFNGTALRLLIFALLIPILSYVTQLINIKMMPTAPTNDSNDQMARQMKTMNMFMPLMSLFFCFTVPVGLGVYWIFSAVVRAVQQFFINRHFQNLDLDDVIAKNQEKAKKKREKKGITEDQIRQAAQIKTKSIGNKANLSTADKELKEEVRSAERTNFREGSLASKANMVKNFNEKNNRK